MDVHCNTRMARNRINLPTLNQMLNFCMSALRIAPPFFEAPASQPDSYSGGLIDNDRPSSMSCGEEATPSV
jgi:hypothetical protein